MPLILGIESTCDETAAALVADGWNVRSNVVATQVELHAKYRGVVPEIASRAHIENLLPVLTESLEGQGDKETRGHGEGDSPPSIPLSPGRLVPLSSSIPWPSVDAIAVAHRPGLIGSLLVGVTAAKTLAWALGKPLIGVDHVHAHLYSVMLERNVPPVFPAVGLVCSGGHTALYRMGSWLDVEMIGSTIDDAVGEAYDKVAALLGLGYPGGPVLDRLAADGDPKAVKLPRTLLGRESLDFSFSGLKTAVLYHVRGVPAKGMSPAATPARALSEQEVSDIAASFQAACIEVIVEKLRRAVREMGAKSVVIGGGVSANQGLRDALARFQIPVYFPLLRYCTDNAAMSAGLAHVLLEAGRTSPLDLDAVPFSELRR
jgi:N6-L-threonylcarbamoyladenine synthase